MSKKSLTLLILIPMSAIFFILLAIILNKISLIDEKFINFIRDFTIAVVFYVIFLITLEHYLTRKTEESKC
jgi:hypothetical protein